MQDMHVLKFRQRTLVCGTWLSIGSPVIAELAATCSFDWVLLDLEHGCESEAMLPNQLRALRGSQTTAIIRVPALHPELIGRALDWGAHGIMVPHVNSSAEAESIVQAACYAPRGHRGFSRTVRAYDYGLHPPDPDAAAPILMAQIENIEGVMQAGEIARVDGIDVLFVGMADLQHDLNHRPAADARDFNACLEAVVAAAASQNKSAGILIRDLAELQRYLDLGFTCMAVDSDLSILRKGYMQIQSKLSETAGIANHFNWKAVNS
jgi:2-dehydro-3-deoxyglucarate aldolase/4-hydroxy-2-oxoheptanedioate aldolase